MKFFILANTLLKRATHFARNNYDYIIFPTRFTALGSIYFVHETWTNTVEIYDWHVSNYLFKILTFFKVHT